MAPEDHASDGGEHSELADIGAGPAELGAGAGDFGFRRAHLVGPTALTQHIEGRARGIATACRCLGGGGGPIEILSLVARCVTTNDGTASTLQWSADPTDGAAVTISGASASLASVAAGGMVVFQGTTLATAPLVSASGANIAQAVTNGVVVGAGIITSVIGAGSTTGTWQMHMRYRPLARGVTVS